MIIRGKVRKRSGRGRTLGFPTANIDLHQNITHGVYLAQVNIKKQVYSCLVFIGNAKTFNEKNVELEVHIPNFKKNLYAQWISVKLLKRIRGNIKFNSKQALIKQIKKDLNVFRNNPIFTTRN